MQLTKKHFMVYCELKFCASLPKLYSTLRMSMSQAIPHVIHAGNLPFEDLMKELSNADMALAHGSVPCEYVAKIRKHLFEFPGCVEIANAGTVSLFSPSGFGYFVLTGIPFYKSFEERTLPIASAISCLFGQPFRVIQTAKLWNRLEVDTSKPSYSAFGVGYNNVHIDVPNAVYPPDMAVLLCERQDPNKGGHSIVSFIGEALSEMSTDELKALHDPVYEDGLFFNLENVGEPLNPFPVLSLSANGQTRFRFTGKLLFNQANSGRFTLIKKLETALLKHSHMFVLLPGEMLFLNQFRVCHGKKALGPGQELLSANIRRVIWQTKLRICLT